MGFLTIVEFSVVAASVATPVEIAPALQVTYLGNCGFLLRGTDKAIVIDGLFSTSYNGMFDVPSPETVNRIIAGEKPFSGIDLLLITHKHEDHLNPILIEAFLQKNPQCKLVCPTEANEIIRKKCRSFEAIKSQIINIDMELFAHRKMTINGIALDVLRLRHGLSSKH